MKQIIDNDKMWASIRREASFIASKLDLVGLIDFALKEQGLQYNPETKGIEEIVKEEIPHEPKFKVGDTLKKKGKNYTFRVDRIQGGYYFCDMNNGAEFPIDEQDNWELVEQKSAWSKDDEEIKNIISGSLDLLHDMNVCFDNKSKSDCMSWLNVLSSRVQPKREWSEEDELMLTSIIQTLKLTNGAAQMKIDWLKNLKGRVQPQSKQGEKKVRYLMSAEERNAALVQKPVGWSEEDKYMLYGVMETESYMLDVVNRIKEFDVGNDDIRKACTKELDWLKSLKDRVLPQPKQEWSEEDDKALKSIINDISQGVVPDEEDTNWLKSLRPQNRWKPSEEQMIAIQEARDIVGILTITGCRINSLYQDLKKLREE